jgi:exodeoxyribonuclease V alpha subunit
MSLIGTSATGLWRDLEKLLQCGIIRQIDFQSAKFLGSKTSLAPEAVAWLTALLSRELGRGHSCIRLLNRDQTLNKTLLTFGVNREEFLEIDTLVQSVDWLSVLEHSEVVGNAGEEKPLIFDGERLYFHRYWHYEVSLTKQLTHFGSPMALSAADIDNLSSVLDRLFYRQYPFLYERVSQLTSESGSIERQQLVCDVLDVVNQEGIDWERVGAILAQAKSPLDLEQLDELIPTSHCLNWQKVAAAVALCRRFTVISGGPGTGKTTTVAKLLAAVVLQQNRGYQAPNICLVAPTGKAAARLTESIGNAIGQLPIDPTTKALIPIKASTLHRLLGSIPHSSQFRHHSGNKLHLDILVVDEASMVDLPMMCKLFDALPSHARVILLGDKDQLASVEAGAVLGDICSFLSLGYSAEQSTLLSQLTGFSLDSTKAAQRIPQLCDSLCMLRKSYRFDHRSGIGLLANAVNQGDVELVESLCRRGFDDIAIIPLTGEGFSSLLKVVKREYQCYLDLAAQLKTKHGDVSNTKAWVKPILDAFNQCRLLCAVREGEFGVLGLNQRIERLLNNHKLISMNEELWYIGRPIMILQNDYNLGLFNGDIGICLPDISSGENRLKVYFELPDGTVKGILPSRIPQHELAYAMTIHKSQGSEFHTTLMILPMDFSPVLTRELIYTGITRAKKQLNLYADNRILRRAIGVKTERISGLTARFNQI